MVQATIFNQVAVAVGLSEKVTLGAAEEVGHLGILDRGLHAEGTASGKA